MRRSEPSNRTFDKIEETPLSIQFWNGSTWGWVCTLERTEALKAIHDFRLQKPGIEPTDFQLVRAA